MSSQDSIISNSSIEETTKIYKSTRIVDSNVGENCTIGDNSSILKSKIEDGVIINRNCAIDRSVVGFATYFNQNDIIKNAVIGKFCCISWNVTIYGESKHNFNAPSMYTSYHWNHVFGFNNVNNAEIDNKAKTIIGNDVWIGNGAIIINAVSIGDGSIIGAGTVVTKDVPPYSVVVGVPGKVIKKRFDDKTIERLLDIKWWDWPHDIISQHEEILRIKPISEETLQQMEHISNNLK